MRAGFVHGHRVFHDDHGGIGRTPLSLEPAHLPAGLGSQAEMAEADDAGVDDRLDLSGNALPAFQLDGIDFTFLEETHRVPHGILGGSLVGAERHVADHERVGRTAAHCLGMAHAVVHGHRDGSAVTQHNHAQ